MLGSIFCQCIAFRHVYSLTYHYYVLEAVLVSLGQEIMLILVPLHPFILINLYSRRAVLIIKALEVLKAAELAQHIAQAPDGAALLPIFGVISFREGQVSANSERRP